MEQEHDHPGQEQVTPEIIDSTQEAAPGDAGEGVDELREALAKRDTQLLARMENEQELLQRLREALLASDPEVDPDLVTGDSLAELEESFAKAKAVASRLRDVILPQGATRVPAGAPGRVRIAPSTPFQKIREGLSGRS